MRLSEDPSVLADPIRPILQMPNGHCLPQAIHVAAVLGIADLLEAGPTDAVALASATGTDGPSLLGLLRALASAGIFVEESPGRFALTATGATLGSNAPGRSAIMRSTMVPPQCGASGAECWAV